MKQHAIITNKKGEITIKPAVQGAKTKVNGSPLTGPCILSHKDRILFGESQLCQLRGMVGVQCLACIGRWLLV